MSKNKKFEIVNGKLIYLSEGYLDRSAGDKSQRRRARREREQDKTNYELAGKFDSDADYEDDYDESGMMKPDVQAKHTSDEGKYGAIADLGEAAKNLEGIADDLEQDRDNIDIDYIMDTVDDAVKLIRQAMSQLDDGMGESVITDSTIKKQLIEAIVIAGMGKGNPNYIKKLIRGLQKLHKGELTIKDKDKIVKQIFDRFNKSQELDPFFDDKAHGEEGTLKDKIEDMLDDCPKSKLRKIADFINNMEEA